jgi:ubiquinone/menaquinone biosynthesis C-methylase UbiE
MSVKEEKLHQEIQDRYEPEATACSCLGCGSTVETLRIAEGERILDLGCGRGEETLEAASLTGPTGLATGLDLTSAMVVQAKENAKAAGVSNATFVQGDIESLPFPDESFDGVMSNCVINHAKDKTVVYREINRVLKPGGRFVIADAVTKQPLPPEVKNDPQAWAECYGGAITEEEYLEAIQSVGFSRIDIINRREYIKNGYDFASLTIKAVK